MSTTSTAQWGTPENIVTALTTELNTLAAGAAAIGASVDNGTDRYLYISFELLMASVDWSAAIGLYLPIWCLYSLDGTNYEDGLIAGPIIPARTADGYFAARKVNGAQRLIFGNVPLLPYKFMPFIQNGCTAALAAANNTLKYRRHNEIIVT